VEEEVEEVEEDEEEEEEEEELKVVPIEKGKCKFVDSWQRSIFRNPILKIAHSAIPNS
jgi:hypothetical protein